MLKFIPIKPAIHSLYIYVPKYFSVKTNIWCICQKHKVLRATQAVAHFLKVLRSELEVVSRTSCQQRHAAPGGCGAAGWTDQRAELAPSCATAGAARPMPLHCINADYTLGSWKWSSGYAKLTASCSLLSPGFPCVHVQAADSTKNGLEEHYLAS